MQTTDFRVPGFKKPEVNRLYCLQVTLIGVIANTFMNTQLIKSIEQNKTPVQKLARRLKKNAWKFKLAAILTGFIFALALFWYVFKGITTWYDEHKVTFPKPVEITLRYPIKIEERYHLPIKEGKALRIDTQEQISASLKRDATIERIYQYTRFLESRFGFDQTFEATHTYCANLNQVNQIGYFPNGNRKFCFKDEAEQKLTFIRWLTKRINEGYTMSEALCYFVTGLRQPQCKRSMDVGL